MKYFDDLETRNPEVRERALFKALEEQLLNAKKNAPYFAQLLEEVQPHHVKDRAALAKLPVTRKSDLIQLQKTKDFSPYIAKIRASGADTVITSNWGPDLILMMRKTRFGSALRAIAIDPTAASIIGINVQQLSALAFALGGALIAISGVLVSTFSTVSAGIGIQYTLKALIIVIVGGPGRMGGALAAGILLGVAETVALQFVSGLALAINYAILILVLLIRPKGLFARG